MTDAEYESGDRHGPNHVVLDVPPGGRDVALEVLQYRVGPYVNFAFFRTWREERKLVMWGEKLSEQMLRQLGDACHELEQEYSEMAMYDAAKAADRMEGKFVFTDYEPPRGEA